MLIHFCQPLQLAAARIGVEKGIFRLLSEAGDDGSVLTSDELSSKAAINPILMSTLLPPPVHDFDKRKPRLT